MATVQFVSIDYIKQYTPLTQNVDADEIKPFIFEQQQRHVKDVLGENLYNRITDGAINNNLTSNENTLINYIKPYLAFLVVYDALPFISMKLRNKSVLKASGDNLNNISESELLSLRNELKQKYEYYLIELQNYLCKNGHLYPQYNSSNNMTTPNMTKGYNIDLYLDDYVTIDKNIIKKYFL